MVKRGRPRVEDPVQPTIAFRVRASDLNRAIALAEKSRQTKGAILRRALSEFLDRQELFSI